MNIPAEKREQACQIAAELGIDLWMVCQRESSMQADPVMELVIGQEVTWQSFFFFNISGDTVALVGSHDEANFKNDGYSEVIGFTKGVKEDLLSVLESIDPAIIGINYSEDDPGADGLTVGMYRLLKGYLGGTEYANRLTSAESLVNKLRSRKLRSEIARLRQATEIACDVWREASTQIRTGMSEREIAAMIDGCMTRRNVEPSFVTIVNAGDKSEPGHGQPTEVTVERGDLVHVDFGVRYEGYCSDIQRLLYLKRRGETEAPDELQDAFSCVKDIITECAKMCLPANKGFEVDALARRMLVDEGYPEYQHALGHQLGRAVHDGGGILGPEWERYGRTPTVEIERNNVFTLELEIMLAGIGCVGLEEDVLVTDSGAEFFGTRQMELMTV